MRSVGGSHRLIVYGIHVLSYGKAIILRVLRRALSLVIWPINRLRSMSANRQHLLYRIFVRMRTIVCGLLLFSYRLLPRSRTRGIRSVLHVSILSSKQYMLSRLLRAHNKRSHYFALNTGIDERLLIGYDYAIPYTISLLKRKLLEMYYLWMVFARHDVIHFHFNSLLSLDEGWEIPYLKKMNKVLVFHFRGCDLRQKSINLQKNPDVSCCKECDYPEGSCDTDYQRMRLSKARQAGDLFFVTTPDLQDFFAEAEHVPFITPYGIDFENVVPAPRKNGVFRIVSSSNHPGVDGLPHLRSAISRLKGEGFNIEYIEVVKKPLSEALSLYKSADLYAGKLMMGYYNNANIETMLMGVPNMAYIREEFLDRIPDCPIIIARPDNVYEKLKEWVQKPEELKMIGAKGPAFIKKYHDSDKIVDHMISRYNEVFQAKMKKRSSN